VEPVRVKVYGLVSMTRRAYLMQLAGAALLIVVLLTFRWQRWPELRPEPAKVREPRLRYMIAVFDQIHWIAAVVAALLVIEAWFVLRRFTQKEAERASQAAP
jgi:hypothetical protein